MTKSIFYEDGQDSDFNEQRENFFYPMEGILTEIADPNIVLETITNQREYLALKLIERAIQEKNSKEINVVQSTKKPPSHTIIVPIHASSVLHVVLKKPPLKSDRSSQNKKIKKINNGKKRAFSDIVNEKTNVEEDENIDDNAKPVSKGTNTAHFIKFINELLDVMDFDHSLKGSYIVMDNASIHKLDSMKREVESRRYRVMYLPRTLLS
ncbi:hypothetical protein PHYBLDRAFT_69472 [Phycomyces blakesleeanus NRRL 1555(-)]|uniref:Tc1-like transposase DDE domain-containing protein n=1 Tax=Phycomyces blakesleeanus (strain ATCC 8743b / DSM 1359 / FGSC 10004 / NBRC 33097 / NRRL 1555) TaxID=763407 RepID=A0A167LL56_PHYB8|nr:hypothetical protein PHYBLDRAFT_69472 [Phycomyces blakesleeanus NRRL 1555(-)]OAD70687.1 hypothetical protein PHYBLDRAFT_69472 [Phycomyces blakesleeanus NRRL 1555(-)]|eukprot:XP_018288727.1 hypothetical protein PHYBLDRAFT_69472 [Phycomyces blakesleeanus NRRL 1555(-)]